MSQAVKQVIDQSIERAVGYNWERNLSAIICSFLYSIDTLFSCVLQHAIAPNVRSVRQSSHRLLLTIHDACYVLVEKHANYISISYSNTPRGLLFCPLAKIIISIANDGLDLRATFINSHIGDFSVYLSRMSAEELTDVLLSWAPRDIDFLPDGRFRAVIDEGPIHVIHNMMMSLV